MGFQDLLKMGNKVMCIWKEGVGQENVGETNQQYQTPKQNSQRINIYILFIHANWSSVSVI